MYNRNGFGILLISGLIAVGAIGLAFFTAGFGKKDGGETALVSVQPSSSVSQKTAESSADLDADTDGLPNWKETLYGTDPNNADSDGDGMNDGNEVATGANPLVYGTEPESSTSYVAPKGLTSTEALARELFVGYAGARQDGSLNKDEIGDTIATIVERYAAESSSAKRYILTDIQIENDVNLDAYAGSVTKALKDAGQVREYELSIFARAIEKESEEELQKLAETAKIYTTIKNKLLALEVPGDVAPEHLAFVNSMEGLAHEIQRMSQWGGDPLDALVLVGTYGEAEDDMVGALDALFAFIEILKKQS